KAEDAAARREQQADDEPTPGEFVRNDVVPRVSDRDAEEYGSEQSGTHGMQRRAVRQDRDAEQHADQRFNERVLTGDGRVAPAALAAQPEPREERDVVAPGDRLFAVRTGRARPH